MKRFVKYTVQAGLVILASAMIGLLMLAFVFRLPLGGIAANIQGSTASVLKEPPYFSIMPGVGGATLDNYTEIRYLNQTLVGAEGDMIDAALGGYEYIPPEAESYQEILERVLQKDPAAVKESTLSRFWCGYLVFIKPLLMFVTYPEIRCLNLMLHCLLMFGLLHLMHEKGLKRYELPLLLTYLLMNPMGLALNMTFAGFFYCTVIPCILMLLFNDWLKKKDLYVLFFVMIGVCVIYFNMNYFQIITFGIPIVFYFILNGWPQNIREFFDNGILLFAAWFLGYAGMMVMKWIVYAIFISPDIFTEMFQAIVFRTSAVVDAETLSRADAIQRNIDEVKQNRWWRLSEYLFVAGCVWTGLKNRVTLKGHGKKTGNRGSACGNADYPICHIHQPCVYPLFCHLQMSGGVRICDQCFSG